MITLVHFEKEGMGSYVGLPKVGGSISKRGFVAGKNCTYSVGNYVLVEFSEKDEHHFDVPWVGFSLDIPVYFLRAVVGYFQRLRTNRFEKGASEGCLGGHPSLVDVLKNIGRVFDRHQT